MVHIQAITIRLAVSQCTDFMPLVSPTPIIEPEIVCDELKKKKKTEDSGEYWIDLYDKTADPHLLYEYTLARLMIGTLSSTPDYDDELCNSNDLMKIQTNLTFMNM